MHDDVFVSVSIVLWGAEFVANALMLHLDENNVLETRVCGIILVRAAHGPTI